MALFGIKKPGYGEFDTGSYAPPVTAPSPGGTYDTSEGPGGFTGTAGQPDSGTLGHMDASSAGGSDPYGFASIFKKYGLDPSNPTGLKSPLANMDYFTQRMGQTGGSTPGNLDYWRKRIAQEIELAQQGLGNQQEAGSGGSAGYGGAAGNTFTDPATAEWESMLRSIVGGLQGGNPATGEWESQLRALVQKMQTPDIPSDYEPMVNQLRGYRDELNRPGYTPTEMDLLQTQSIDPLMASRDAMRQQTLQRLASRGITPDSGVAQELLSNVDRGFAGQEAQTRSGFASQAIQRDAARKGRSAQLAMMLPQLEQGYSANNENRARQALGLFGQVPQSGTFASNEARKLQGLGLMGQIPALADKRLGLAQSVMQPTNGIMGLYGLLSQLAQQQGQYNQGQQGQFWQMIAQLIPGLFK